MSGVLKDAGFCVAGELVENCSNNISIGAGNRRYHKVHAMFVQSWAVEQWDIHVQDFSLLSNADWLGQSMHVLCELALWS